MQLLSKHVVEKKYNIMIENYRYNTVGIAGNNWSNKTRKITVTQNTLTELL